MSNSVASKKKTPGRTFENDDGRNRVNETKWKKWPQRI
jgi:hypothetical protein